MDSFIVQSLCCTVGNFPVAVPKGNNKENRTWNSHSEPRNSLTTSKATYNQTMFFAQAGNSEWRGGCPALTPSEQSRQAGCVADKSLSKFRFNAFSNIRL